MDNYRALDKIKVSDIKKRLEVNGKKLFWCRNAVRKFEKSKLYKLKDVLDAHATFTRDLAEMRSGHRG